MKTTLRMRPGEAPTYFIFKDPDTNHIYKAPSKEALFRAIISYREQNRLAPIEALEFVLEDFWCRLPTNCHKCFRARLKRGWVQYMKGGVALIENILMGPEKMVSSEESEARARICSKCPHNVFPDKGPFLKWTDEIAEAATGGRTTSLDSELGNCEVCSCPLRAKVHCKPPFGLSAEEEAKLPDFCWQKGK